MKLSKRLVALMLAFFMLLSPFENYPAAFGQKTAYAADNGKRLSSEPPQSPDANAPGDSSLGGEEGAKPTAKPTKKPAQELENNKKSEQEAATIC